MEIASRAFEMTGTVDSQRHLVLDNILPIKGPRKVRKPGPVLYIFTLCDLMHWFRLSRSCVYIWTLGLPPPFGETLSAGASQVTVCSKQRRQCEHPGSLNRENC